MSDNDKKFKDISLLYLCEREVFLHRTSRVRFHAVEAIERQCKVVWSGPGWDNWDEDLTLDDNIARLYQEGKWPDIVFCYKPYTIKGFANTRIPTCVSYNEMGTSSHPRSYTVAEIMDNHVDLVICHHHNEMLYPEFRNLPCKMINISHCVDESVFKDYHLPKNVDVLLVGAIHHHRYPLRTRLSQMILRMRQDPKFSRYTIGIWNHPGGSYRNAFNNRQIIKYAQGLNSAKICLTCSGRYRSRYGKYAEIPACRSLLMADLPDEDHAFFKQFVPTIDMKNTDKEIEDKILYYLENDEEREALSTLGYELTHSNYTQDHYAERFLKAITEYLTEFNGQKIPNWNVG